MATSKKSISVAPTKKAAAEKVVKTKTAEAVKAAVVNKPLPKTESIAKAAAKQAVKKFSKLVKGNKRDIPSDEAAPTLSEKTRKEIQAADQRLNQAFASAL